MISRKQVQTYLAVLGVGMLLGLISGWIIRPALEPAISGNRYLPFAQYEFTEDQQQEMKLSLEDTSIKYRFDRKNRLVLRGRDSVYEFYAWLNENMTEVDSEYVLGPSGVFR